MFEARSASKVDRCFLMSAVAFAAILLFTTNLAYGIEQPRANELARTYLNTSDKSERRKLANELAAYDGPIDPILTQLSSRSFKAVKAGYHPAEHFADSELRKRHPDDLLYFTVPTTYRPRRQ